MQRKAYKQTRVPVSRTQEAIRKLFRQHGVMGCQFTDNFEAEEIALRFVKRIHGIPRTVRIVLPAEGNEKQAYRAMYYWLKSQMEAVEFGLLSFEHIFLAHFEWMLETGETTTVADIVIPRLAQNGRSFLLEGPTSSRDVDNGEWKQVD